MFIIQKQLLKCLLLKDIKNKGTMISLFLWEVYMIKTNITSYLLLELILLLAVPK